MEHRQSPRALRAAVATLPPLVWCAAMLLGCSQPRLAAHWRDTPLRIDGAVNDWLGSGVRLGDTPARVLVANDGEYLYLGLASDDPPLLRLIAHRGLTLWLDPRGGRNPVLGIRFPLPNPLPAGRRAPAAGEGRQPRLDGLELLGPRPQTRKWVAAPGEHGVAAALAATGGTFGYEVRVPLASTAGWGLDVRPGATIGVGVHAPRVAPGGQRAGGRPGRSGGGRGPGGGGPPAGGGPAGRVGAGDHAGRPLPELDVWVRLRLASGRGDPSQGQTAGPAG